MVQITLDSRRRAPLSQVARPEDTDYLVEVLPNGAILMTPAEVVSKDQLTLNRHPEILDAIDQLDDGKITTRMRYTRR
jgi:hypothetical protein